MAHRPCIAADESEVEITKNIEAGTAEEIQSASETVMTLSSSGLQVPADDVLNADIRAIDPYNRATEARTITVACQTTDKVEDVEDSSQIITSVILSEAGEPETLPGTPPDIANYAQGTDNNDTAPEPMHTSTNESANESNVTSPTAQHGNTPSQDSAAIMPDEIHDCEVLSDVAGKCDAFAKCEIHTIVRPAATDVDDTEDEDGGTTPRNRDMASPIARSTENDDDDTSP
ncbi:hypothetical protein EIP86_008918 [Pleurotus ostreatoroseus]|nr:hypothetical protein EIP86_008918 [Pleurotus ostreatoroseus]